MKDEWIKAAGAMTGIVHFGKYFIFFSDIRRCWFDSRAKSCIQISSAGLSYDQGF